MRLQWLIVALVGTCLSAGIAAAQEAQNPTPEAVYFPLFSESMIRGASAEQAARMRASEADNRQRFEARQKARRDQQTAANEQTEAKKEPSEPPPEEARAPAPKRGKSKVYKWVDANGRVHFGDAPQGRNAQEIKIGGAARIAGTPPPARGKSLESGSSD